MHSIIANFTLLLGVAVILAGSGLVSTLLGVRGDMEQFSSTTLGLIMAGYFIGYVLGTFQVPKMIRQFGHIRMFAALASVASVTTLLHGLYINAGAWFGLRVISGMCIVGLYIVIESWLNEQTDNEQRGHIFSAYMTTTLVGLGIGQALLLTGDITTLHLFALSSVLFSLGLVPIALTKVVEPPIVEAQRLGLARLYSISPLGVVGAVFAGVGAGAFWGLGPVFAAGIGLDARGIAGFMGLTILGGTIMLWPVGRMSDRFDRRHVLAWVCALTGLMAVGSSFLLMIDPIWVLAGGFAYGAFTFNIYALSASHTNDHVEHSQMLEVTSTLQLLWGSGAIAGPIAAGVLMQFAGPETLLGFIATAAIIPAIFAWYRMMVSEPIPLDQQGEWVPQFATSPAAVEMYPEPGDDDDEDEEDEDDDEDG